MNDLFWNYVSNSQPMTATKITIRKGGVQPKSLLQDIKFVKPAVISLSSKTYFPSTSLLVKTIQSLTRTRVGIFHVDWKSFITPVRRVSSSPSSLLIGKNSHRTTKRSLVEVEAQPPPRKERTIPLKRKTAVEQLTETVNVEQKKAHRQQSQQKWSLLRNQLIHSSIFIRLIDQAHQLVPQPNILSVVAEKESTTLSLLSTSEIAELSQNKKFVNSLKKYVTSLLLAWNWDIVTEKSAPQINNKFSSDEPIADKVLFQLLLIGRSLILLKQFDLFNGLVAYLHWLHQHSKKEWQWQSIYDEILFLWESLLVQTTTSNQNDKPNQQPITQDEGISLQQAEHNLRNSLKKRYLQQLQDAQSAKIGTGGFGCVYAQPGLTCPNHDSVNEQFHNSQDPRYVSKLLLRNSATAELRISEELKTIDPDYKWFIYLDPDSACDVTMAQLNSCDAPKIINQKAKLEAENKGIVMKDYVNYSMLYGGQSYSDYLSTANFSKMSMSEMLRDFITMAQAVQILHKNGFIHRDLSLANVVRTDEKEPLIRLIDWGLAGSLYRKPHDWNSITQFFDKHIIYRWPPEFWTLCAKSISQIYQYLQNSLQSHEITFMTSHLYPDYAIYENGIRSVIKPYKEDLKIVLLMKQQRARFQEIRSKRWTEAERFARFHNEFNIMLEKGDSFLLAQMMIRGWRNFGKVIQNTKQQILYDKVFELLKAAFHPDYMLRLSLDSFLDSLITSWDESFVD
jgi:Protein kinase domain